MLLLEQKNIEFELVEYIKFPLSKDQVLALSKKLNKRPKEFIRTSEKSFKENNMLKYLEDDDKMASYISHFPKIMERPIFIKADKAVIGRPVEKILELLGE